jgi:hypothetical protein
MKKPFTYASLAILYIACLVLGINSLSSFVGQNETLFIPIAMLSLFVLSASIMGFLFISEPLLLGFENRRKEAVSFFLRTIGFFACYVAIFGSLAIAMSYL